MPGAASPTVTFRLGVAEAGRRGRRPLRLPFNWEVRVRDAEDGDPYGWGARLPWFITKTQQFTEPRRTLGSQAFGASPSIRTKRVMIFYHVAVVFTIARAGYKSLDFLTEESSAISSRL